MSIDRLPSEETDEQWVFAQWAAPPPPEAAQPGRWFIYGRLATIDATWVAVRDACRAGQLGRSAQCTTAHPALVRRYSDNAVIRVDTDDWRDEAEVWRIERVLRDLGVTGNLNYRVDSAAIGRTGFDPYRSVERNDGTYVHIRRPDWSGEPSGSLTSQA